jgi:hypothetical protein
VPGTAPEWLTDPTLAIVVVEGEKKALGLSLSAWHGVPEAAEKPAFLVVGLPGVWNFRDRSGKTEGPDGSRRSVSDLTGDIRRIVWKGRKALILFDTNVRDNDGVQAARQKLTAELQKMGALISWFAWPDDTPAGLNGIDDLIGLWGHERVRHLIANCSRPVKLTATEARSSARVFSELGEDHYRMAVPALGITFDVDRLRREHHELIGELCVRCELPGARTVVGRNLSIADFNLSSARACTERAKLLATAPIPRISIGQCWSKSFASAYCKQSALDSRRWTGALCRNQPREQYVWYRRFGAAAKPSIRYIRRWRRPEVLPRFVLCRSFGPARH